MTVQAMAAVFELGDEVAGANRLVLLSLANHANDRGECWPGHACVSRETALHKQTVKTAVRWLVEHGYIERDVNAAPDDRIRNDKKSNLYRLVFLAGGAKHTSRSTRGVSDSRSGGVNHYPAGGANDTPKPSVEPSENPERDPSSPQAVDTPRPAGSVKKTRKRTPRDDLFDALVAVENINPDELTKTRRSHLGKLASELVEVNATPDMVAERARAYRTRHPDWQFTAASLVKYWADCGPKPGQQLTLTAERPDSCDEAWAPRHYVEEDPEVVAERARNNVAHVREIREQLRKGEQ